MKTPLDLPTVAAVAATLARDNQNADDCAKRAVEILRACERAISKDEQHAAVWENARAAVAEAHVFDDAVRAITGVKDKTDAAKQIRDFLREHLLSSEFRKALRKDGKPVPAVTDSEIATMLENWKAHPMPSYALAHFSAEYKKWWKPQKTTKSRTAAQSRKK